MIDKSIGFVGGTSSTNFITWVKNFLFSVVILFRENCLFPTLENTVGSSRCVTGRVVDTFSSTGRPVAVLQFAVSMTMARARLVKASALEVTSKLSVPPSVVNFYSLFDNFGHFGNSLGMNNA